MKVKDLIPWSAGKRELAVRRENASPVQALQFDINRAFDDFWRTFELAVPGGSNKGFAGSAVPSIDVRETDKEIEVVAELPGMDEKDVEVSVADGALTIRGVKDTKRETQEKGYVLRERSYGRFERIVPLPEGLKADAAKAEFKKGVLTVTIPKTDEARSAVKRIRVNQG
jgi:HSP20 family protein